MPHVIIKLIPGKTEEQKQKLTDAIVGEMKAIFGSKEEVISVAFEEIPTAQWKEKVVKQDIRAKPSTIYRMPGYSID